MADQRDRREHLSVKIATLAAEARIIRNRERSLKRRGKLEGRRLSLFKDYEHHRKHIVRPEARANLLAYACLKGVPYCAVESAPKTQPNWKRVEKVLSTFLTTGYMDNFTAGRAQEKLTAWREASKEPAAAARRGEKATVTA